MRETTSGGCGAQPHATEPFTKTVIHVFLAVAYFLRIFAGLRQLLSFPENSELVCFYVDCGVVENDQKG